MSKKETEFFAYLKEIAYLNESIALLDWDSQTGMPEAANEQRGEVSAYLSGLAFEKSVSPKMADYLAYFRENEAELSELGKKVVAKVQENYDLNYKLPAKDVAAYDQLVASAHGVWVKARQAQDFTILAPTLEKMVGYLKQFIPLWQKDEATPYDVLLNQYEPNMTVAKLDAVFEQVKTGIMAIRAEISENGTATNASFKTRYVSRSEQESFVRNLVEKFGYDFSRGRLDDTVHPFMTTIHPKDARITTRWDEHDFAMALFGVIHEAGHGLYEQNIDPQYDRTPLAGGTSMGIHESQSLFHEIILGSHPRLWEKQFPAFQAVTGATFGDLDQQTFYRGLNQSKSSLIRIEADSLTYPLHIIIRYEIEKMIFNEELPIADLPRVWSEKYQEYLGITPSNDTEGVLQDVHWSGGMFGYFPSYALGYMYAAQLYHAMQKDLDVDSILLSEDYTPIRAWLTEHIHQYGASKKPNELILAATGEELNPSYLVEHMRKVYQNVYQF